jgi:hypothetical protein
MIYLHNLMIEAKGMEGSRGVEVSEEDSGGSGGFEVLGQRKGQPMEILVL